MTPTSCFSVNPSYFIPFTSRSSFGLLRHRRQLALASLGSVRCATGFPFGNHHLSVPLLSWMARASRHTINLCLNVIYLIPREALVTPDQLDVNPSLFPVSHTTQLQRWRISTTFTSRTSLITDSGCSHAVYRLVYRWQEIGDSRQLVYRALRWKPRQE